MFRRVMCLSIPVVILILLTISVPKDVLSQDGRASQQGNVATEEIRLSFQQLRGDNPDWTLYRAKIPGGWLLTNQRQPDGGKGLTFVPDPDHQWDGGSLD